MEISSSLIHYLGDLGSEILIILKHSKDIEEAKQSIKKIFDNTFKGMGVKFDDYDKSND